MQFPGFLFRRISSGTLYMPEVDGLRFIAILAVVLFHASGYFLVKNLAREDVAASYSPHGNVLGWVLTHGFLGVQLFFTISGFVLALPFARLARKSQVAPDYRSYILRRVTRIEPPYVLALCFYAAVALVSTPESMSPIQYVAGLFYVRNVFFGEESWLFYVSWSLEIEVQFYLIAPALSLVFRLRSAWVRQLILVVAISLTGYYAGMYRLSAADPGPLGGPLQHGWWLGPELAFFLVGMLATELFTSRRPLRPRPSLAMAWDIAWLAGAVLVVDSYRLLEQSPLGIAALLFGLLLVTLGTLHSVFVRRVLSHAIPSAVGGACYTIYLFHTLPVALAGKALLPLTGASYEHDMLFVAVQWAFQSPRACLSCFR